MGSYLGSYLLASHIHVQFTIVKAAIQTYDSVSYHSSHINLAPFQNMFDQLSTMCVSFDLIIPEFLQTVFVRHQCYGCSLISFGLSIHWFMHYTHTPIYTWNSYSIAVLYSVLGTVASALSWFLTYVQEVFRNSKPIAHLGYTLIALHVTICSLYHISPFNDISSPYKVLVWCMASLYSTYIILESAFGKLSQQLRLWLWFRLWWLWLLIIMWYTR